MVKYPTAPYRVLSGHSLGGLMVIDAFVNHAALFNAYIAVDPSLWWDGQRWIKQAETNLLQGNVSNRSKSLFVAIANNIPAGMDTISVMKDTSGLSLIPRSVLPFVHWLKEKRLNRLQWSYKFYPDERHGTVELIAEYDALRYLFNYYQFRTSQFDGHPELNVDSVLTAHFNLISGKLGYKILPSEQLVNNLAYYFLNINQMGKAYNLFKRNTVNYP